MKFVSPVPFSGDYYWGQLLDLSGRCTGVGIVIHSICHTLLFVVLAATCLFTNKALGRTERNKFQTLSCHLLSETFSTRGPGACFLNFKNGLF